MIYEYHTNSDRSLINRKHCRQEFCYAYRDIESSAFILDSGAQTNPYDDVQWIVLYYVDDKKYSNELSTFRKRRGSIENRRWIKQILCAAVFLHTHQKEIEF